MEEKIFHHKDTKDTKGCKNGSHNALRVTLCSLCLCGEIPSGGEGYP